MPTAAKLVSAIFFAALGYVIAERAVATLPEHSLVGWFREIIAGIGLVVGWGIVGRRAEDRFAMVTAAGLTGSAVIVFCGLAFVAAYQMLIKSMHNFYTTPMQALESMFELAAKRAAVLTEPDILVLLICGGLVGGMVAFASARVWR